MYLNVHWVTSAPDNLTTLEKWESSFYKGQEPSVYEKLAAKEFPTSSWTLKYEANKKAFSFFCDGLTYNWT